MSKGKVVWLMLLGLLCMVMVLLFFCVTRWKTSDERGTDGQRVVSDEAEILIISQYINFAEGYQDEGVFIDSNGGVYFYSFSQPTYNLNKIAEEDYISKFKVIQKYTEPVCVLNEKTISRAKELCSKIEKSDSYETECTGSCDIGSYKLYVQKEGELISCRESGDWEGALKSASAKKLMNFYDESILPQVDVHFELMPEDDLEKRWVYYYTDNALYLDNMHCGYNGTEGMYVITNEEERKSLEAVYGDDFGIGALREQYGEEYIFFVECVDVSSGGYDLKQQGFMCKNGTFGFIESEDSKTPGPDEMVTEAMDGFAFVAAFPEYIANQFADAETGSYLTFGGGKWIHPNAY